MLGELPLTSRRGRPWRPTKTTTRAAWVAAVRAMGITPHVAQSTRYRLRVPLIDRTTRHPGYALSQRCTEKGRAALRMDEDRRAAAQAAAPWWAIGRLDRVLHRGGVQPGAMADACRAGGLTREAKQPQPRSIGINQSPSVTTKLGYEPGVFQHPARQAGPPISKIIGRNRLIQISSHAGAMVRFHPRPPIQVIDSKRLKSPTHFIDRTGGCWRPVVQHSP